MQTAKLDLYVAATRMIQFFSRLSPAAHFLRFHSDTCSPASPVFSRFHSGTCFPVPSVFPGFLAVNRFPMNSCSMIEIGCLATRVPDWLYVFLHVPPLARSSIPFTKGASNYPVEILKRSFISSVRPTVHIKLSWKRSFSKTLFKQEEFKNVVFSF